MRLGSPARSRNVTKVEAMLQTPGNDFWSGNNESKSKVHRTVFQFIAIVIGQAVWSKDRRQEQ